MTNTLFCTVGLPRSGKSTWAKTQNFPIVNPDSIRLSIHGQAFISQTEPLIWAIAKIMVDALFLAGHEKVILDATNTTIERRAQWITHDWKTVFVTFDTSKEECIERAKKSNKEELVPVIEKMEQEFEPYYAHEQNGFK